MVRRAKPIGWLVLAAMLGPGLPAARATYQNPIVGAESADPYVIFRDGYYYFLRTTGGNVTIRKSATLQGIGSGASATVFGFNSEIKAHIWAPELHYLDGKWYVYACGSIDAGSMTMRMFVLEGNSQDPMGSYTYKGLIGADIPAIDETVLVRPSDGAKFLVYSRFVNGQSIYIAPLINPWTVGEPHVELSRPSYDWEKQGWWVNEGPIVLHRNGKTIVVYSGSGCSTPSYCLGMLVNTNGDYLNASSWVKSSVPVFERSDALGVWGPGHNGFTTSPDGQEDWIVYHGKAGTNDTNADRSTRIQPFFWNADDTPNFGVPLPAGGTLASPGEAPRRPWPGLRTELFNNPNLAGAPWLTTTQAMVDTDWRSGSPAIGATNNQFSVRWTGRVYAPTSGVYSFRTIADDGARLWIGGRQLVDDWNSHPAATNGGTVTLSGGEHHEVRLEYYDNVAGAVARLQRSVPGGGWEAVPYHALSPVTNGLRGEYFNSTNFTARVRTRIDPVVDFDWGTTIPEAGVGADRFTVRWSGRLLAPTSGVYTIHTASDDGVRFWLDGQKIIENWTLHAETTNSATVTLEAGRYYDIRLDFFEEGGGAVARLLWTPPGGVMGVVPMTALFPPSAPAGTGAGLRGEYFDNMDLTASVLVRTNEVVDFNWGTGSPDPAVGADTFSARWTGQVEPRYGGTYTFHVSSDNGRRLWVNGQLVIDKWIDDWNIDYAGTVELAAGRKVDICLEYFENNGGAGCRLEWESDLQVREVIPAAQLYPPPSALPSEMRWAVDAGGAWSRNTNWIGGLVADGADKTAVFSNNITADRSVTCDVSRTIGGLSFGDADTASAGGWTLAGSGILSLHSTGGPPVAAVGTLASGRTVRIDVKLAGSNGFVKAGAGALVLNAANSFSGPTTVAAGTLAMEGAASVASSPVILVQSGAVFDVSARTGFTLASGQSLAGSGTVRGDFTAGSGSAIAPGAGAGRLVSLGAAVIGSGSELRIELGGTVAGLDHDVLSVTGAVTLAGNLVVTNLGGYAPDPAAVYTVLTASAVGGRFANAPPGARLIVAGAVLPVFYSSNAVTLGGAALDADGDGLARELDPDDSVSDVDGDGMRDGDEYVALGAAAATGRVFAVHSIRPFSDGVVISWPSLPGRVYTLEAATNLAVAAEWPVRADGIAGPQGAYTNRPARAGEHFRIRVRMEP